MEEKLTILPKPYHQDCKGRVFIDTNRPGYSALECIICGKVILEIIVKEARQERQSQPTS